MLRFCPDHPRARDALRWFAGNHVDYQLPLASFFVESTSCDDLRWFTENHALAIAMPTALSKAPSEGV